MFSYLETSVLLIQLLRLCWANPIEVVAGQPDSSIVAADTESGITIPLRRSEHDLQHSSNALRRRAVNLNFAQHDAAASPNYQAGYAVLRSTGASFLAPVSFGNQSFLAIVDTGSADTWVAAYNVQCLDIATRRPIPQSRCYFGPLYQPDKGAFKQIPNENFNITYGDGEFLTGPVGTIDIALSGIKVPNQTVSIVDRAAWNGDSLTSGLIGLAYPALTAAYRGTDPRKDRYCSPGFPASKCNQIIYSSLTDNMFFQQQVAKPVFALALSRDESRRGAGGYITIGGTPTLSQVGVKNNVFASTKIKVLPMDDRLRYYLIAVDGLVMLPVGTPTPADGTNATVATSTTVATSSMSSTTSNAMTTTSRMRSTTTTTTSTRNSRPTGRPGKGGWAGDWWHSGSGGWWRGGRGGRSSASGKRDSAAEEPVPSGTSMPDDTSDYIVDSGTTLNFLPDDQASKFNAMFNPPATYDRFSGFYMVRCNASVPSLGVKINGTVFWHNPKDLVKQYDPSEQQCVSGIQSSMTMGVNILGDVFLDSVLAVFDLGQGVMKFAARREYSS